MEANRPSVVAKQQDFKPAIGLAQNA